MERIIITTARYSEVIKKQAIVYCKAEGSYTRLVLEDNKHIVISRNLSWFENTIASTLFIRPHRSFLVNLEYINRVFVNEGKIGLTKGVDIPVSRYKSKQVIEALHKYCLG
ncbi:LytTR family DNA-binding domain-containing protein [uncultured Draconibacterium sp.]|uniref:LytR/AlgR family response regulator transcription factor n=1 Tax=uncultured Draconibacterium sp. TaxID=1573823 RepID=UPI0032179DE9